VIGHVLAPLGWVHRVVGVLDHEAMTSLGRLIFFGATNLRQARRDQT
jgi:hypothetical protein